MSLLKKLLPILGLGLLAMSSGLMAAKPETATFAGGCFWCMTPPFDNLKAEGVLGVVCGYAGGTGPAPTYEDYAEKGHYEAVRVTYDPSRIGYQRLLDAFWRNIDPTDQNGQFVDRGHQYRTAIFYHNSAQKKLAEKSREALARSGRFDKPIATKILPATTFYPAEDYHQEFYKKNPLRYKLYHDHSGREQFLKKAWEPADNNR